MQASLPLRASRALLPGASSASAFAARGSFAATQPVQNAEAMRSGFRALSAGAARGFAPGASPAAQNAQQSGRVMTGARPVYESSGGAMHSVRADARAYSSHPRVAAPGTHGGSSGGGAQGSMPSMTLSAAGLLAGALVWSSHRTADADAAGGMDAKSVGQALASSDGAEVRKGAAAAQGVEAAAAGAFAACSMPSPTASRAHACRRQFSWEPQTGIEKHTFKSPSLETSLQV